MRVAIVHDYIKEYGGAERVLETLLEIYPDATVFTSLYAPEFLGPHRARFEKFDIKTTFLNDIPYRHKLISPLRLLTPYAFSLLDFSEYDVIIVSQTGAYFPNTIEKKLAIQICYTHTPPRYLYGYATARDWKKNRMFAFFAEIANHFLRIVDYNSSKNVDFFIANSEEVKGRIKKFYRKDAAVIYPPVDNAISNFQFPISNKKGDYYLTGGRLARAKGIDVIVKVFNTNGLPLKIFGKGFAGYESELRSLANGDWQIANGKEDGSRPRSNNIEFLGEISDEEKLELMAGAKAFLFAAYDEDFGITPVEAMSVGTPVIAYKSGGVKETVIDGKTGLFFDENTPHALNKAIEKFEILHFAQNDKVREDCIRQAEKFSKERFGKEIKEFINGKIKG